MLAEKELFHPAIAGKLGNSRDTAEELQQKVAKFDPTAQVMLGQRYPIRHLSMFWLFLIMNQNASLI
jgi:hypothetical protein